MEMKKLVVAVAVGVGAGVMLVEPASAASVIDTTMHTALEGGFTDLMDTVKDVVSTSWNTVIGVTVVLMAPGLVLKLLHKGAGGK